MKNIQMTSQGVRNLDAIKIKRPVPACDGRMTCTKSRWQEESIYPDAAFEHDTPEDECFRAGTVEVRRCLCCLRVMEERHRHYTP
jgi:hypothetical protein